jgi:uncharacterized Rmd1/YagE family protein
MMQKEIAVVLYRYRLVNHNWSPNVDNGALEEFISSLHSELNPLGITVTCVNEHENVLEVKGYADLLNTIRLRSPSDHISNLCLGHIIGQSADCNVFEDLRRGVSRVAFAPEMIEPEGSNKVVCHNCGCGC